MIYQTNTCLKCTVDIFIYTYNIHMNKYAYYIPSWNLTSWGERGKMYQGVCPVRSCSWHRGSWVWWHPHRVALSDDLWRIDRATLLPSALAVGFYSDFVPQHWHIDLPSLRLLLCCRVAIGRQGMASCPCTLRRRHGHDSTHKTLKVQVAEVTVIAHPAMASR